VRPVLGTPGVDFGVDDVRGSFPAEMEIEPLDRPPDVEVQVPGSKSITNRTLIVACLAGGESTIENPLFSDDPYWLMDSLVRLGFEVHADRDAGTVSIQGQSGIIPQSDVEVYVGNAGTVARFLPPVLALGKGPYRIDGVERMRERPIENLVDAMRRLGARVGYAEEEGKFPLIVKGGGIRGGAARVSAGRSSQFVSGLLMAAPYARELVELEVEGRKAWPYVGITVTLMRAFGIEVEAGGGRFVVRPGTYRARAYEVEPDASGAAYFLAAAAVCGGRVRVPGIGTESSQGDLRFVEVLREMGCEVEVAESYVEARGGGRLRGVGVDMNGISDQMITLAAIAPFAEGPTRITGVAHTRHQETDRISAVVTELRRLGVTVEEFQDGLRIEPGTIRPSTVRTYGDHRMAMAFSLVGLKVPGIKIEDPACVTKTLPGFFGLLDSLR
jgi:3-phosphoshikimate 1-carboxyvinyltransferase